MGLINSALVSDKRVNVNISETAILKTVGLLDTFNIEVGWHGTVSRSGQNSFDLEDILVYPQIASASTVNTVQFEYEKWLMTQPDAVFNNLRMHGHSHCNFGVSPSGTDVKHRDGLLSSMEKGMFYIFMIWNKEYKINTIVFEQKPRSLYRYSNTKLTITIDGVRKSPKDVMVGDLLARVKNSEIAEFLKGTKAVVETS